jgi:hypothetical protein
MCHLVGQIIQAQVMAGKDRPGAPVVVVLAAEQEASAS